MADPTSPHNFMTEHLATYLESGGARGHLIDVTGLGARGYIPTLLLGTKGRKTGKRLITPLIYGCYSGQWVVLASNAGAPTHPNWYLNLEADPEVVVQIATQAFIAKSRTAPSVERKVLWDYMMDMYPPASPVAPLAAPREIPVVMLWPLRPTEVFKRSEARGILAS